MLACYFPVTFSPPPNDVNRRARAAATVLSGGAPLWARATESAEGLSLKSMSELCSHSLNQMVHLSCCRITRQDIATGLEQALAAEPLFAPHLVPLALEKLSSTLRCAALCCARCACCALLCC